MQSLHNGTKKSNEGYRDRRESGDCGPRPSQLQIVLSWNPACKRKDQKGDRGDSDHTCSVSGNRTLLDYQQTAGSPDHLWDRTAKKYNRRQRLQLPSDGGHFQTRLLTGKRGSGLRRNQCKFIAWSVDRRCGRAIWRCQRSSKLQGLREKYSRSALWRPSPHSVPFRLAGGEHSSAKEASESLPQGHSEGTPSRTSRSLQRKLRKPQAPLRIM